MARPDPLLTGDDTLGEAFRQFHDALLRELAATAQPAFMAGAAVAAPGAMAPLAPLAPLPSTDAAQAAADLQRRLLQQLDLAALTLRQVGPGRGAQAEAARYLMVALADEVVLHRDWSGRAAWPDFLLETALFGTSVAGDKVFADIERVLSDKEPAQRPLAQLYLFALALGFQGRLRGQDDGGRLAALRRELFEFAHRRAPSLASRGRMLAAQPYANTLSHAAPRRVRGVSRWTAMVLLALAGLALVSEVLWLWQTWPLRRTLERADGAAVAVVEVAR